jgi:hypothetical protein
MSENTNTTFASICDILAEMWLVDRDNEQLQDFIEYNDLGLPLSYGIAEGIVSSTPLAEQYITETFNLLLSALNVEDADYTSLRELYEAAGVLD